MKVISYGNSKALPTYKHLLLSAFKLGHQKLNDFIFYTEEPDINYIEGAEVKKYSFGDIDLLPYYRHKPCMLLQAIEDFPNEDLIYLDSDIILGKRFNPEKLLEGKEFKHPLLPSHTLNWDSHHKEGFAQLVWEHIEDQTDLTPTIEGWDAVQACCVAFNSSHKDFLLDWNRRTLEFQSGDDEQIYNATFKFKEFENLGKIHINYPNDDVYPWALTLFWERQQQYEELENHFFNYQLACLNTDNTSDVMFYHGCQNLIELNIYNK